jgi:hypothetical protein
VAEVGTEHFKSAWWYYAFVTRCRKNLASHACNMFGVEMDQCYANKVGWVFMITRGGHYKVLLRLEGYRASMISPDSAANLLELGNAHFFSHC